MFGPASFPTRKRQDENVDGGGWRGVGGAEGGVGGGEARTRDLQWFLIRHPHTLPL